MGRHRRTAPPNAPHNPHQSVSPRHHPPPNGGTPMPFQTEWRTIDFRPAPPGWQVLLFDERRPECYQAFDLPGWLIQVQVDVRTGRPEDDRRVVPALDIDGYLSYEAIEDELLAT